MSDSALRLAPATAFAIPANPVVEVSAAYKTVVMPYLPEIASLMPAAKRVQWKGQDSLAVPHTSEITRIAHNMGLAVPAPVLLHYDWANGTPFDVQKKTVAMATLYDRCYILNSFGTGKTKSALWAFDYRRKVGTSKRALVVAPLSTLHHTWAKEVLSTVPHLNAVVLHGSRSKRLDMLAEPADLYIVNHDGVAVIYDELESRGDIDTLILDELAVYRNGNANRTKLMRKLSAKKRVVWGMTGSPTPTEPTDAWGQAKIVTPWSVPDSFNWFRNQVMLKKSTFKWIPKHDAKDTVHKVMQPAVRYTLDDVTELPDVVMRTVPIAQGALQERAYRMLSEQLRAMFTAGELTVANSGVLMNKLLQVSLGWVYTDQRGIVELDPQERLQTLVDQIESADHKVIVFAPFIHALDGIEKYLRSRDVDVAVVSGNTPMTQRNATFTAFQQTDKPRVLLAHPVCMAHGLTLTAADTIIWASPYPSLEVFDQANARIRRYGQKHRQQVLMLAGTAVERQVYKRLQQRGQVQNALLDMFQQQESLF